MNGNGVKVPRWFVVAVVTGLAVFGAGWKGASYVGAQLNRVTDLEKDFGAFHERLCRIETALSIPPWTGCPK